MVGVIEVMAIGVTFRALMVILSFNARVILMVIRVILSGVRVIIWDKSVIIMAKDIQLSPYPGRA